MANLQETGKQGFDVKRNGAVGEERNSSILPKVLFPAIALIVIALDWKYPDFPNDNLAIVLVIAAGIPWLPQFLDKIKVGDVDIKFQLNEQQKRQNIQERRQDQQEREIRSLKFLVEYFLSGNQNEHLERFEDPSSKFLYDKNDFYYEQKRSELRRLREFGLIEQKNPSLGFTSIPEKGDFKDYFQITVRGRQYLSLRKEWQ